MEETTITGEYVVPLTNENGIWSVAKATSFTYVNEVWGYALDVPDYWVELDQGGYYPKEVMFLANLNSTLVIRGEELPKLVLTEEYAQTQIAKGTDQPFDSYELVETVLVTFDSGINASKTTEIFRRPSDSALQKGDEYFFVLGDTGFSIFVETSLDNWDAFGPIVSRVVRSFTSTIEKPATKDGEQYYNEGDVSWSSGEYREAIELLSKALQVTSTEWWNYHAYYRRGDSHKKLGEYQKANQDYSETIRLAPDWYLPFSNRGEVYSALGQHEKAIEDHTEAIRLAPDEAYPFYSLGITYQILGEYQKAILNYDKAILLEPDNKFAIVGRGDAYSWLDRYQPAIQDYDKAIQLDPDYASAYAGRGIAYHLSEEYQKAIQDYDKAIQLDPTQAKYYADRGNAYTWLGQWSKSDADKAKACSLDNQYC
jgi:tetratricopeptide (TPR) repeat protein